MVIGHPAQLIHRIFDSALIGWSWRICTAHLLEVFIDQKPSTPWFHRMFVHLKTPIPSCSIAFSSSALRSGPVRFLHIFFAGPRPVRSYKFPEPKKTGPEPVKTDENQFKPVRTSPGINVVKHSLNQNILQMCVKINCRPLFYVYFKPLTIQIGWELNKLFYIS